VSELEVCSVCKRSIAFHRDFKFCNGHTIDEEQIQKLLKLAKKTLEIMERVKSE
jgi:hypothetical protein